MARVEDRLGCRTMAEKLSNVIGPLHIRQQQQIPSGNHGCLQCHSPNGSAVTSGKHTTQPLMMLQAAAGVVGGRSLMILMVVYSLLRFV